MSRKFKKIKIALFLLVITMIAPVSMIINAAAATSSFNFSIDGLKEYTSKNYSIKGEDFSYRIDWDTVVLDGVSPDQYYLQVNLQKRNALVFWVSQSNIRYPGAYDGYWVKANFHSNLGESTIRLKLFNYGAYLQEGTVKLIDN